MSESDDSPRVCTAQACLEANEGQRIVLEGTYLYPQQQAFANNKVRLTDGVEVIIGAPREGVFTPPNHESRMRVTGRIFTGQIPESYRIFGRPPNPHLLDVEISSVEIVTPEG